jgi:hypothetical protein
MADVTAGNGAAGPATSNQQGEKPSPIGAVLGAVLGFLLIAGPLVAFIIFHSQTSAPTSIGLGALEGLVVLSASLAGLIIVFQALGLSYPEAALGLPKGSVRALLALSLVVIFVAVASWNLGGLFDPTTSSTEVVPTAQAKATLSQFAARGISAFVIAEDEANTTIRYLQPRAAETQAQITDMAKEIMTVVSTVLVTIVGFYFGSSSTVDGVRSAQNTMASVRKALFNGTNGTNGATDDGIYTVADFTQGATGIGAIATGLKTRLTSLGENPTAILSEAAGSGAEGQQRLKEANEAYKGMKDASRAASVYAGEANALSESVTADTDQTTLDDIGPKMSDLQGKATESKATFDAANEKFTAAYEAILGTTASG